MDSGPARNADSTLPFRDGVSTNFSYAWPATFGRVCPPRLPDLLPLQSGGAAAIEATAVPDDTSKAKTVNGAGRGLGCNTTGVMTPYSAGRRSAVIVPARRMIVQISDSNEPCPGGKADHS